LHNAPLFNIDRFVPSIEAALLQMYERAVYEVGTQES